MITSEIDIGAAQHIVIPSGRDYERCLEALEAEFGVSAPRFDDRLLSRKSGDTEYTKVKGKDIPAYVSAGYADIGLTSTDVCEEQIPEDKDASNLLYKAIGEPMCAFNLLLPNDQVDALVARLNDPEANPVQVATSYPRFLLRCIKRAQEAGQVLNIVVEQLKPSGSVEALPGWTTEAAADIVETGETALANGLAIGPKLADIYPAIVSRDPNKPPQPLNRSLFGVDASLGERVKQAADDSLTSYSLERLRNPNQALKEYGEESAEFLDAVIRGSDTAASELADLIFSGLVLSRANGGKVTLAEVIQILENRNSETSLQKGTK
jgi:ATP phosphoribosyltransferase